MTSDSNSVSECRSSTINSIGFAVSGSRRQVRREPVFRKNFNAGNKGAVVRHRRSLLSMAIALICVVDCAVPVNAQTVTSTGPINTNGGGTITSSSWDIGTNELDVGDLVFGQLDITAGGKVINGPGFVGGQAGGVGIVNVSGTDNTGHASTWNSSGQVAVGYDGLGTVHVDGGGNVNSVGVVLGLDSGAPGAVANGTVTVSGNDGNGLASTWTSTGSFTVGDGGTGTLKIDGGGMVSSDGGSVGDRGGSSGDVTVSGRDSSHVHASTWTSSSTIFVGNDGAGTLKITDGGLVDSVAATIGNSNTGGGTVTVSGNDGNGHASTWTNSGNFAVGEGGGGELDITGGGVVSSGGGTVGAGSGSNGKVTVSGRDSSHVHASTWTSSNTIFVGVAGTGTLKITDGGLVDSIAATIGNSSSGDGTVTVSGSDGNGHASAWTSSGNFIVGEGGAGELDISGGGMVSSAFGTIGNSGGSGIVTVSGHDSSNGNASVWAITNGLIIGGGSAGSLQISDGGAVRSGAGMIGNSSGGNGSVSVSDAGSIWDFGNSNLYVGFSGTGDLKVLDGGTVSADSAGFATIFVGDGTGSHGTVMVSSSNGNVSTLSTTLGLIIGNDGTGTMTIAKGGKVSVGFDVQIAAGGGSAGTLHLQGDASGRGVLEASYLFKGTGNATLDLNGGILRAAQDQTDFLRGFATLGVGAEGAWFDTNSHDIGISTEFSGTTTIGKLGPGTLTLTGNSSNFLGTTEIHAGTLEVDGLLGGSANVLTGGRLSGTGQVGPTVNNGVVAPGHSSGFGTLTVAGNYSSATGGLEVKTRLGDDSSPTDLLVVTGGTSGTTGVSVINVGGLGAQTQNGIEVVQVNGASAGQFTLVNGSYAIGGQQVVVAGAYGYVLQKNAADGSWYLRSSLLAAGTGGTGGPGGISGTGGTGGTGSSDPVTGSGVLYQPGVPVYEAYAGTLLSLSSVSTLRQRIGNRLYDADDAMRDGVWGRVEGKTGQLESSVSTTSVHQDIDSWKAQFGIDRILSGEEGGARLVGGLSASYGTANAHMSSVYGDGGIDTKAFGLGAALTWYDGEGTYIDTQAQATWFNSDLNSGLAGVLADGRKGHGYAMSVETGKSLPVREGLSLIPQAQLSYVAASFDDFNDRFGAQVSSDKGASLLGRAGLALDYRHDWQDAAGKSRRLSLYGLINIRHEFLDGSRVLVSGTPVDSRPGRTWTGVGVGGNYSCGDGCSVYTEIDADTDLDNSYMLAVTAGVRMKF